MGIPQPGHGHVHQLAPLQGSGANRQLHHAVEIRHDSFEDPDFIALLRKYGVALVFADTVEWPYLEDLTADFVYARLHGSEQLYTSGYEDAALDWWAARLVAWAQGGEAADRRCVSPARPARRRGRTSASPRRPRNGVGAWRAIISLSTGS